MATEGKILSDGGRNMNYKVLVAEDDKDIANLLKLYLNSSGYDVKIASNGEEAYDMALECPPDIGVFDIMMDKMDGYELTMKLRQKYTFPIIFLSAKNLDTDKILGLDLGADDYMTKPFNPLEVVARVKSNLRRYYQFNDGSEQEKQEKSHKNKRMMAEYHYQHQCRHVNQHDQRRYTTDFIVILEIVHTDQYFSENP